MSRPGTAGSRPASGFLYLAVVVDVWSRRVVGWAMATHLRTQLVLEALDMALVRRRPCGVIPGLWPALPHRRDPAQADPQHSARHLIAGRGGAARSSPFPQPCRLFRNRLAPPAQEILPEASFREELFVEEGEDHPEGSSF
jgi:transposase InsO family protein